MGLIDVNEKALCSAIYGTRDAARNRADKNSAKIEHLECELNLLRIKVKQLEKKAEEAKRK